MEEVAINPTIEPPELTQDWGNRLLEGTNKTLCTQDPGERSSDPHERLTQTCRECPGAFNRSVGQLWPAAGLGALSAAVRVQDLLKEIPFASSPPP